MTQKSFPEVVGKTGEEAKQIIESQNPQLKVHVLG